VAGAAAKVATAVKEAEAVEVCVNP
jgi:hypothetical protein